MLKTLDKQLFISCSTVDDSRLVPDHCWELSPFSHQIVSGRFTLRAFNCFLHDDPRTGREVLNDTHLPPAYGLSTFSTLAMVGGFAFGPLSYQRNVAPP